MTEYKDYLGHNIHIGDILLYNERASKGYRSSFTEGVVIGFNKGKVEVVDVENYKAYDPIKQDEDYFKRHKDTKYCYNTLNLSKIFDNQECLIRSFCDLN